MKDPEGHNQIQKESKTFIKNFVFLLVKKSPCTFGTKHFAIFSRNT